MTWNVLKCTSNQNQFHHLNQRIFQMSQLFLRQLYEQAQFNNKLSLRQKMFIHGDLFVRNRIGSTYFFIFFISKFRVNCTQSYWFHFIFLYFNSLEFITCFDIHVFTIECFVTWQQYASVYNCLCCQVRVYNDLCRTPCVSYDLRLSYEFWNNKRLKSKFNYIENLWNRLLEYLRVVGGSFMTVV